jgi:hypothetical protein
VTRHGRHMLAARTMKQALGPAYAGFRSLFGSLSRALSSDLYSIRRVRAPTSLSASLAVIRYSLVSACVYHSLLYILITPSNYFNSYSFTVTFISLLDLVSRLLTPASTLAPGECGVACASVWAVDCGRGHNSTHTTHTVYMCIASVTSMRNVK